jgi:2'-phosphotransferase
MASSDRVSDIQAGPPQSSDVNDVKKEKAPKTRGRREDTPEVRNSKTLSYILRHGAAKEGLKMRTDGFVRVDELVRWQSCFVWDQDAI